MEPQRVMVFGASVTAGAQSAAVSEAPKTRAASKAADIDLELISRLHRRSGYTAEA